MGLNFLSCEPGLWPQPSQRRPYLWSKSSLVFDLLAQPGRLLGDAVGVEAVDLVLDGQRLRLLVLVG